MEKLLKIVQPLNEAGREEHLDYLPGLLSMAATEEELLDEKAAEVTLSPRNICVGRFQDRRRATRSCKSFVDLLFSLAAGPRAKYVIFSFGTVRKFDNSVRIRI